MAGHAVSILVKVIGAGQRTAQIVSAGPPGTIKCHWARTCDGGPGAWLLVKEQRDPKTDKIEYLAIEQK